MCPLPGFRFQIVPTGRPWPKRFVKRAGETKNPNAPLDELIKEIEKAGPDLSTRIGKAIELIQDDYRYLSVNLEFGGQIPTPPEIIARRRYGDCKDLSFLLVNNLLETNLGVSSRPVLQVLHRQKNPSATSCPRPEF